jgi:hypothetical protein
VSLQVPDRKNVTSPNSFTEHTPGVELVTDVTPSPFVETAGVNESPTFGDPGIFEMVGALGAPGPTINDWGEPSAASKFDPPVT